MRILVTGAAGFIGSTLSHALLARRHQVVGFDNFNDYYPVALKEARAARLEGRPGFRMVRGDLADSAAVGALFSGPRFDVVVNLAAQAGVRYSLTNPMAYVSSNLTGFVNVLEACRHHGLPRIHQWTQPPGPRRKHCRWQPSMESVPRFLPECWWHHRWKKP